MFLMYAVTESVNTQQDNISYDENVLHLTLSWRRPLSYRNQSIDLGSKSMDWFLYDNGLRHVKVISTVTFFISEV